MTKVCKVCGMDVSEYDDECPNCGSRSFIKLDNTKKESKRFRY